MIDLDLACKNHAEDNKDLGAFIVKGKLTETVREVLSWTSNIWEDGVPIVKYFSRCENPQHIVLNEGTFIQGVCFYGKISGLLIFHFYVNGSWYELKNADSFIEKID